MTDNDELEKRLEKLITTGFAVLESKIGDLDGRFKRFAEEVKQDIGNLDGRIGDLDGRFKRFAEEVKQDLDDMRDVGERTERRLVALETRPPIGVTPPRRQFSATVLHSVSAPIRRRTGYYGS